MSPTKLYSFDKIVQEIGAAGVQVTQLGAAEGSAGNISVFVREFDRLGTDYHLQGEIALPVCVPALARGWILISGTGRRLRDLATTPQASLCVLHVHAEAGKASIYSGADLCPSSELNSHLAIHNDRVAQSGLEIHSVLHAQPTYLTFLSHLPGYADTLNFNRRLLRWEPELIVNLPEGVGIVPFQVPGSAALQQATVESLRSHRIVVWCKHGVVARSDISIKRATDRIEYAEAAAHYEYLDLANNNMADGLSDEEIQAICQAWSIQQNIF